MTEKYKIYAIPINPFIIAECVELAHAIYEDNKDILTGYAEYLIDEATTAMSEYGIEPDIIAAILAHKEPLTDD